MNLKSLEINGFKSFAKKSVLYFNSPISSIVGPNGSGKSNVAESFRFVLGEQSFKSMRGKRGEDLIFGGTATTPKQNRASVKVTFDNKDRRLPIDFDEISIERIVHRDGVNEYLINGSAVRLKDVHELLASANIGSSGHHIISQGEADRLLNSSIKERKQMLEDALGLRIYQFKKIESQKKLEKTEENIQKVESLRREIIPHLKFLKKQVEKIEEGKKLRESLKATYQTYLKIESAYIQNEKQRIALEIEAPQKRLREIESDIHRYEAETKQAQNNELIEAVKRGETAVSAIFTEKSELQRKIGRVEGQIASLEKLKEKAERKEQFSSVTLTAEDVQMLKHETEALEANLENISALREIVGRVVSFFKRVTQSNYASEKENIFYDEEIQKYRAELLNAEEELVTVEQKELHTHQALSDARVALEADKSLSLEAEKKIIALMSEKNELQKTISHFAIALDTLERDEIAFKQENTEAAVLVGRDVLDYNSIEIAPDVLNAPRETQIARRKDLERMKIKVEELGAGSGEEILKEFNEVSERDGFLLNEISDLEKSAQSFHAMITAFEQKIEMEFESGLEKINVQFQKFFELMFGGGNASLKKAKIAARRRKDTDFIIDDEGMDAELPEEAEEGVDITVNLPRKKVRDLMMLSGGERALTSIALLFAISQVNPPPFIILDETDAALDEANSRKYGDMIESLSAYSQLILITHNRETMSRAGVLYGVTMVQGVSQLLSVAFEEGIKFAK